MHFDGKINYIFIETFNKSILLIKLINDIAEELPLSSTCHLDVSEGVQKKRCLWDFNN